MAQEVLSGDIGKETVAKVTGPSCFATLATGEVQFAIFYIHAFCFFSETLLALWLPVSRWAARTFLPSVLCGFANSCYGSQKLPVDLGSAACCCLRGRVQLCRANRQRPARGTAGCGNGCGH
eukprot:symbB.v1.2.008362.t1/scaffold524.1/size192337/11